MNTEMENFAEKWSIFFEKMQKNVVRSDEVHPKKLQKKVTILHILSSKRVVPTAKFAKNTSNFRKRLANLQAIKSNYIRQANHKEI